MQNINTYLIGFKTKIVHVDTGGGFGTEMLKGLHGVEVRTVTLVEPVMSIPAERKKERKRVRKQDMYVFSTFEQSRPGHRLTIEA